MGVDGGSGELFAKGIEMLSRQRGRPSSYSDEFPDLLVEHMALGFSFESFGGRPEVNCSLRTLYNWKTEHDDFLQAYERGCTARALVFENVLIGVMTGKIIASAAPVIFALKNVAGWRDRLEFHHFTEIADDQEAETREIAVRFIDHKPHTDDDLEGLDDN